MIVCLCKSLTEEEIHAAIANGATTAKKVHAALKPEEVKKPCPSCVTFITRAIREHPELQVKGAAHEHEGWLSAAKRKLRGTLS